jgi:hypothetical protein
MEQSKGKERRRRRRSRGRPWMTMTTPGHASDAGCHDDVHGRLGLHGVDAAPSVAVDNDTESGPTPGAPERRTTPS